MSDLFSESRTNVAEFTVSEISNALRRTVEDAFGNVRVRGEISGYRGPHSSGHAYFSLKDERARIDAVIWRTTLARLKFRPEEGMEVVATGRLFGVDSIQFNGGDTDGSVVQATLTVNAFDFHDVAAAPGEIRFVQQTVIRPSIGPAQSHFRLVDPHYGRDAVLRYELVGAR